MCNAINQSRYEVRAGHQEFDLGPAESEVPEGCASGDIM